jgi:DNA-binding HxlR family transcriptional regulator
VGLPVLKVPEENACGCIDSTPDSHGCLCSTTGLVQIVARKNGLRLLFLIGERDGIRFNEIMSELDDMSTSTLSIRLVELEQAGLVCRQEFAEMPPRVEYRLTPNGEELRQSLFNLSKFASKSRDR